jgi:hypothetical protein
MGTRIESVVMAKRFADLESVLLIEKPRLKCENMSGRFTAGSSVPRMPDVGRPLPDADCI